MNFYLNIVVAWSVLLCTVQVKCEANQICPTECRLGDCIKVWKINYIVKYDVLTAVITKSSFFRDITPCSQLKVNRRFGGTCRLHLSGSKHKRNKKPASRDGFLLYLFFDHEDGGDMFLQNFGWLPTYCKILKCTLKRGVFRGIWRIRPL
jgi:hypothetical protein